LYAKAGVDLATEPVVGVGSVCRRSGTRAAGEIITAIRADVESIRIHAFGVKVSGLRSYGRHLASSDSLAWSFAARHEPRLPGCVGHRTCANCPRYAFAWRYRVLASIAANLTDPESRPPGSEDEVCRKLDTPHARRLALAAFHHEAARLERNSAIRWARRDGLSVRAIAAMIGLSAARVQQILGQPSGQLHDQVAELRQRWNVDADPDSRAAADLMIANIVTLDQPHAMADAA
jgi:hypothetical protein